MVRPVDVLTGLLLDGEMYPAMESLISEKDEFAVITLDIDGLLVLNQDFGHEAGDAVFRLIAKHICALFKPPCLGFRNQADQFSVLMPGRGKEDAFLKAEELRKLIFEEKLDYTSKEGKPLSQSVSIGVSSYPDDGSRPADVFRRANSALARAKKNGRNTVCLAREEKLLPKTSHYTQTQLEKLFLLSEEVGIGESSLLREALDDLLKKHDV